MSNEITYRLLSQQEEFFNCEVLQQETWGFADLSVVPAHLLITFQKRGGLVIGAFDGDQMVGFVYGFVGHQYGMATHNSVMSAVRPEYRNQGIAYQLKIEQRKMALEQQFSLMTWTFDPLQGLNAHFNLNKLGVIIREYFCNIYGVFRDEINKGLPTDRFGVEWWMDSPRVERRLSSGVETQLPPVPDNAPSLDDRDLLRPGAPVVRLDNCDQLHLGIPISIDELKSKDAELALEWRYHIRGWFEAALASGLIIHGFTLDRQRKMGVYTLSNDLDTVLQEGQ